MAKPSKRERATADRLSQRYAETWGAIGKAMALEVFGANIDVNGYTTVAQAERLARVLQLKPEMRVLDVGAGAGWPGLHVAKSAGSRVVLADQPRPALLRAARHARRDHLERRAEIVQMTATALPFRPGTFDAIVHTDVMCWLSNKLSVLRALRRLLVPGGRIAFITIHTPAELDAAGRKLAYRLGPRMVNSRDAYASLLERAGFHAVRATDMTKEYLRISRGKCSALELHQDGLRAALGEARAREMQSDCRHNVDGILRGVLRRSMFVAMK